jgi:hypothetical protein
MLSTIVVLLIFLLLSFSNPLPTLLVDSIFNAKLLHGWRFHRVLSLARFRVAFTNTLAWG